MNWHVVLGAVMSVSIVFNPPLIRDLKDNMCVFMALIYDFSFTWDCTFETCFNCFILLLLVCPLFPGWNKQVDYEPGTGSKQLFPKMHLETCGGPLSSVRTTVELQTSHIGKGCDRETYSEKSLQKLCGQFSEKNQRGQRH